jgi:L-ascorbate metabolism protein UlaG (beta-lactamase superfamily)
MSSVLPQGWEVQWLGHATFAIRTPGFHFIIDPFLKDNPRFPQHLDSALRKPGAFQAIFLTHAHYDHFADVVPLLKGDPDLKVVTPFEIGNWIQAQGIPESQIVGMGPGGTVPLQDIRITMTAAIHSSSLDAPGQDRSLGAPVGFVLRFANGFTIYDTGDTAVTMDMQIVRDLYHPDLVILPIGDLYTMGAEQAAYALKLLQPRYAIGCHFHTWGEMPPGKPELLLQEMERQRVSTQLIQLKPGETLT